MGCADGGQADWGVLIRFRSDVGQKMPNIKPAHAMSDKVELLAANTCFVADEEFVQRLGALLDRASGRHTMDKNFGANLLAQDVQSFGPVMDLEAEEWPTNVEAVKPMAEHDRMARDYNVVVDLWILHHIVDPTGTACLMSSVGSCICMRLSVLRLMF